MHNRPWFKRKKIGFGYSPQTWQGWLCTFAFAGLLAGSVLIVQDWGKDETSGRNGAFVVAAVEIMGFMIFVKRNTGEK